MRQLFFGGTFNPLHLGHLITGRAAAERLGFDRITLLPAGQPPHKRASASMAAAGDRLAMTRLGVENDPSFQVDSLEIDDPAPSYTIDTVRKLRARNQGPIHWLIGADMLLYLPQWHKAEELLTEVTFIVMARPGWSIDWQTLPPPFRALEANVVVTPLISITATDIRERVAAGKSIRYLTPDRVCDYIQQHGLYR